MRTPALFLFFLLAAACLPARAQSPAWDTRPDTWVGADALGRVLPTQAEAGPPRAGKTVGMFYFLTFDRGGDGAIRQHPDTKVAPGGDA